MHPSCNNIQRIRTACCDVLYTHRLTKIFLLMLFFMGLQATNKTFSQCMKDLTDSLPRTITTCASDSAFAGSKAFANADDAYAGWRAHHNPEPGSECWMVVRFDSAAQIVRGYSVTAFDDGSGTTDVTPAYWLFQASNDSASWTTLHTVFSDFFLFPGTTHVYSFANNTAYRYYRLFISHTTNTSSAIIGIADMQLFADVCLTGTVFTDNGDRASAYNPLNDTAMAGVKVSIVTSPAGNVVADTVTDALGRYFFAASAVPASGSFSVMVTPPAGKIFTTHPANIWSSWVVLPSPEEEPATGSVFFDYHKTGSQNKLSDMNRMLFPGGNLDFGLRTGIPASPFTCNGTPIVNMITEANNGNFGTSSVSWIQAHPHQKGFIGSSNILYSSINSSATDYSYVNDPGNDPINIKGVLIREGVYTVSAFPGTLSDINDIPYTNSLLNNVHGGWRKSYGATTADAYDKFLIVNGATTGTLPFFKQTGLALAGGMGYTLAFNGKHANSFAQVGNGFADAQLLLEVLDKNNGVVSSGILNMAAPVSFTDDRPESPWQNLSFSFTAPGNNGPFTIQLRANTTTANGNDFYIDNIVLYPCAMTLLPLQITSFTAAANTSGNVKLNFVINNPIPATVTIQYSADGLQFTALDTLHLAAAVTNYAYLHHKPINTINYYRLAIKDNSGEVIYSGIQKTGSGQPNDNGILMYPNPVTDKLFIESPAAIQDISLINMAGQTLKTFSHINGNHCEIDSRKLPAGFYYVRIAGKTSTTIQKVFIKR